MHRVLLLLLASALGVPVARGEEDVPAAKGSSPPLLRGSVGGIRAVKPPPPAPVGVATDSKPPVQTMTAERMGNDGIAAFQSGNFEGAKEAYERVLKVEPNNLPALVNLGAAEFRLGHNDEAERLLRRSLQIKADNPTAWLNLSIIYLQRNEPMRALAAAAQAVVHAPNDPVARNYLGVAAGRNRWFDAAEAELRRSVELKPDYADAHFNLAVFCLERVPPATELAKRHYREARRLGAAPDPLIEKAIGQQAAD
ncbi:MAG: tetratricopeptide repeat protein [Chthoniobacterales bacterium]|jgi:Flp pilus assembly protein TadD